MAAADADDGDTSRVIGERCGRMVGGVAGCVKKLRLFGLACHYFLSLSRLGGLGCWSSSRVGSWLEARLLPTSSSSLLSSTPRFGQYLTSSFYPFYQEQREMEMMERKKRILRVVGWKLA